MPREPSEVEIANATADKAVERAVSIVVGKINSYDHITQRATADVAADDFPPVEGPVGYLGSSNYRVFGGAAAGDDCLIIFCARDPSQFVATGELTDGPSKESYGALWPVIIPMKLSLPSVYIDGALSDDMRIGSPLGTTEVVFGSTIQLGSVLAADPVALNSLVVAAMNAMVTAYNVHGHTAAGAGPPTVPMVPTITVGATKTLAL